MPYHTPYLFLHSAVIGVELPQAMASFMPETRIPQAVVCAFRVASAFDAADAVAQFCRPLYATQMWHSLRWDASVDQRRYPKKARTRMIPASARLLRMRDTIRTGDQGTKGSPARLRAPGPSEATRQIRARCHLISCLRRRLFL